MDVLWSAPAADPLLEFVLFAVPLRDPFFKNVRKQVQDWHDDLKTKVDLTGEKWRGQSEAVEKFLAKMWSVKPEQSFEAAWEAAKSTTSSFTEAWEALVIAVTADQVDKWLKIFDFREKVIDSLRTIQGKGDEAAKDLIKYMHEQADADKLTAFSLRNEADQVQEKHRRYGLGSGDLAWPKRMKTMHTRTDARSRRVPAIFYRFNKQRNTPLSTLVEGSCFGCGAEGHLLNQCAAAGDPPFTTLAEDFADFANNRDSKGQNRNKNKKPPKVLSLDSEILVRRVYATGARTAGGGRIFIIEAVVDGVPQRVAVDTASQCSLTRVGQEQCGGTRFRLEFTNGSAAAATIGTRLVNFTVGGKSIRVRCGVLPELATPPGVDFLLGYGDLVDQAYLLAHLPGLDSMILLDGCDELSGAEARRCWTRAFEQAVRANPLESQPALVQRQPLCANTSSSPVPAPVLSPNSIPVRAQAPSAQRHDQALVQPAAPVTANLDINGQSIPCPIAPDVPRSWAQVAAQAHVRPRPSALSEPRLRALGAPPRPASVAPRSWAPLVPSPLAQHVATPDSAQVELDHVAQVAPSKAQVAPPAAQVVPSSSTQVASLPPAAAAVPGTCLVFLTDSEDIDVLGQQQHAEIDDAMEIMDSVAQKATEAPVNAEFVRDYFWALLAGDQHQTLFNNTRVPNYDSPADLSMDAAIADSLLQGSASDSAEEARSHYLAAPPVEALPATPAIDQADDVTATVSVEDVPEPMSDNGDPAVDEAAGEEADSGAAAIWDKLVCATQYVDELHRSGKPTKEIMAYIRKVQKEAINDVMVDKSFPRKARRLLAKVLKKWSKGFGRSFVGYCPPASRHKPFEIKILEHLDPDVLATAAKAWGGKFRTEDAKAMERHIAERLLASGLLRKGTGLRQAVGPFARVYLVPKFRNGELVVDDIRLVWDFRGSNMISVPLPCPTADLSEMAMRHVGMLWAFQLDLMSAFYSIRAFTKDGVGMRVVLDGEIYELTRLPMGHQNSASVLQVAVSQALEGINYRGAPISSVMDDVAGSVAPGSEIIQPPAWMLDDEETKATVTGESLKDPAVQLVLLFEKTIAALIGAGFTISGKKTKVGGHSLEFAGRLITDKGVDLAPHLYSGLDAIKDPSNKQSLEKFVGLANQFRLQVPALPTLMSPLEKLLSESQKKGGATRVAQAFAADSRLHAAVMEIKRQCKNAIMLEKHDPAKPVWVFTDAQRGAFGAMVAQWSEEQAGWRILACWGERSTSRFVSTSPFAGEVTALYKVVSKLAPFFVRAEDTIWVTDSDRAKFLFEKTKPTLNHTLRDKIAVLAGVQMVVTCLPRDSELIPQADYVAAECAGSRMSRPQIREAKKLLQGLRKEIAVAQDTVAQKVPKKVMMNVGGGAGGEAPEARPRRDAARRARSVWNGEVSPPRHQVVDHGAALAPAEDSSSSGEVQLANNAARHRVLGDVHARVDVSIDSSSSGSRRSRSRSDDSRWSYYDTESERSHAVLDNGAGAESDDESDDNYGDKFEAAPSEDSSVVVLPALPVAPIHHEARDAPADVQQDAFDIDDEGEVVLDDGSAPNLVSETALLDLADRNVNGYAIRVMDKRLWLRELETSEELSQYLQLARSGSAKWFLNDLGLLMKKQGDAKLLVVPDGLRATVVGSVHASPGLGDHVGPARMLAQLSTQVWFPDMREFLTKWCSACPVCCSVAQRPAPGNRRPMQPVFVRNQVVHLDLVHLGPRVDDGGPKAMVMVDHATRFIDVYPVDSSEAPVLLDAFKRWYSRHGVPNLLVADEESAFTSKLFKNSIEALGARIRFVPKRTHRSLMAEAGIKRLRASVSSVSTDPLTRDWARVLPECLFVLNNTPLTSHGMVPAFAFYSNLPRLSSMVAPMLDRLADGDAFVDDGPNSVAESVASNAKRIAMLIDGFQKSSFQDSKIRAERFNKTHPATVLTVGQLVMVSGNVKKSLQKGLSKASKQKLRFLPNWIVEAVSNDQTKVTVYNQALDQHTTLSIDEVYPMGKLDDVLVDECPEGHEFLRKLLQDDPMFNPRAEPRNVYQRLIREKSQG